MTKKLYRSSNDRVISGVCGGFGEYLGIDPTLVRVVAALLALGSFGTAVLVYLLLAIIIPLAPQQNVATRAGDDVLAQ
ncbi:MAG: PspC domain-containing protein [Caldilineae bacterium]|nr:PspC domain-containing protein [Anaerolineae bacterium]MCB0199728.1 PspC domain-containing protein [Anaerolineae bacterium]MCB0205600.1 PspC domain-containing protein [Anaerolineae bacterium]MCB0252213.1 PspC domain-containing protein [Anaerolineae bacterium]MCB9153520.1 PspC domain-containing protein [Caldilineae bacterium]